VPPLSRAGPLAQWWVAIKDNFELAGQPCTAGSRLLAGRVAQDTATAVRRLQAAGATVAGRTAMVELAFGGWGVNSHGGIPRNPWDAGVHRVAGGSSSGSAVAVAARLVRAALGTDTAGSVRIPAALCGVTGFKPSFGRVPTNGVVPLAPSYDTIGPIATSAADCAALDAVLADQPLGAPAAGGRIGVLAPVDWPVPVEPAVAHAAQAAADVLRRAGFDCQPVRSPFALAALTEEAGTLIAHEAWQIFGAAFDAAPQAFGAALGRRLASAGTLAPVAIAQARAGRIAARQQFADWMAGVDALLLPAVPCAAPAVHGIEEGASTLGHFTRWVNHVGGCAVSLPAGLDAQGLPVALQLVGRDGTDAQVLGIARAFQAHTSWHRLRPPLCAGPLQAPCTRSLA
jgi:aspartyl-tRNA(Asn)/glutamyl-tRNA(Gln) amidotransferase subunit A